MTQRNLIIAGVTAAVLLILLLNAMYIVRIDQQAIVTQFGQYQRTVNDGKPTSGGPGVNFKIPFVQNVIFYDKRNLGYDQPQQEITAADQQRLIVDAIVRYRIRDPLQFYRSAQTKENGEAQLGQRLTAALRGELGQVRQPDIISGQRAQLMVRIRDTLAQRMSTFGVEIIDVRIRRADLPKENSDSVYERMRAEFGQKAEQYRSEGQGELQRIKGEADKERQVILADAQKQSELVRGEGDAKRTAIYSSAFNRDPEFYAFYRSMQAYQESIKPNTPMILSPDSDFFKYFKSSTGR